MIFEDLGKIRQRLKSVKMYNPTSNSFGNAFYGAGSGLIRGGLGAYGEKIIGSGSEYVQSNISKYFSDPQYYFQVNGHYVWNKLKIVLLPFLHRGHWTRITEPVAGRLSYKPPINDINAPDLYIPCMAFATYLVLAGISLGISGKFSPEALNWQFVKGMVGWVSEVMLLKISWGGTIAGHGSICWIHFHRNVSRIAGADHAQLFILFDSSMHMHTMKRTLLAEARSYDASKHHYLLLGIAWTQFPHAKADAMQAMGHCTLSVTGYSTSPPTWSTKPNPSTSNRKRFVSLLQNCNHINQIPPIHAKIIRNHHDQDPFIVLELLRMCSNLNSINYANKFFSYTQTPNVFLYTALIDGEGIHSYYQMINSSILPDKYVIASVLNACGCQLALRECREVHWQVSKLGLSSDRLTRMKLLEGYGKSGAFDEANQVFEEMPQPDREGVMPNQVTIVCVLYACAELGALHFGRWVHSYIGKYEIKLNHFVGGALINMYSRCGGVSGMEKTDVSTYNSMITGLSLHGRSSEAVELFRRMIKRGLRPTSVTFVGPWGRGDLGFDIFNSMARDYRIQPQIEHYGCMIDLLGRLGRLEEACNFLKTMEVAPDHVMLGALLSACKIHRNLELGEQVARSLVACGNADSGTYALLSNVYSSFGKWKEAAQVRAKMKEMGIEKEPGYSSIKVNNEIH
ncbi:hypothetical protein Tsubulata_046433, partial [Turnera subulata]